MRKAPAQQLLRRQSGVLSNIWFLWVAGSVAASTVFGLMIRSEDHQSIFMPGPLSAGHHQLEGSCGSCHTSEFGGDAVLQDACIDCHGHEREDGIDSHPASKFEDPRNASRLDKINAMQCITCHVEHQPVLTTMNGLTQPRDLCIHCHSDIEEERASHAGMEFDTCASSGCHNYHDNRALYTKFLINHKDDPDLLKNPLIDDRNFADLVSEIMEYPHDTHPVSPLGQDQADAPVATSVTPELSKEWFESSHANAGVNCSACHQSVDENGELQAWVDKPGLEGCSGCHEIESRQFGQGKHGMRIAAGLTPMTPAKALIPMHEDYDNKELTCVSCHGAHTFDTQTASVDACMNCHADEHTLAYKESRHYELWLAEVNGHAQSGSGVSCAGCHMPREERDINDWMERVVVNHNQNDTLSPNSKMIRPVCLSCHGLEFSINALADEQLIKRNFTGAPDAAIDSVSMARRLFAEHERKKSERQ